MIVGKSSGLVLIAEMNPIVRMVTADLLDDAGFRTGVASSTDEVLSMLRENPEVRVLITDHSVCRPRDGIELAHQVRELWPDVHIIVTSGAGGEVLPPAVCFLQRPYALDILLREVGNGFPEINPRRTWNGL